MIRRLLAFLLASACAHAAPVKFADPPHDYWTRPLTDRFTRLKADLESGKIPLDTTGEVPFLRSLLRALNVPESSQMLVFSATSLQQAIISPRNPRALYFNEEFYVGYVPGGKVEVISIDPALGGIYYMFPFPRDGRALRIERSGKCMNCHVNEDTRNVPGLVVKSVIAGPNGGSLMAFRKEQSGHGVPYTERFGGWYVTGTHGITGHWGNVSGDYNAGQLEKIPQDPATGFDPSRYPLPTSDILPQLIHEHQAGFDNRVIEAVYQTRELLAANPKSTAARLDKIAQELTRYILFADEAPLPAPVEGDPAFKAAFLRNRRVVADTASLKDLDLKTRLFTHRCSYMIYTPLFQNLDPTLKQRIYRRMAAALDTARPDPEYAYLSAPEKQGIRTILRATLTDLPKGW